MLLFSCKDGSAVTAQWHISEPRESVQPSMSEMQPGLCVALTTMNWAQTQTLVHLCKDTRSYASIHMKMQKYSSTLAWTQGGWRSVWVGNKKPRVMGKDIRNYDSSAKTKNKTETEQANTRGPSGSRRFYTTHQWDTQPNRETAF